MTSIERLKTNMVKRVIAYFIQCRVGESIRDERMEISANPPRREIDKRSTEVNI